MKFGNQLIEEIKLRLKVSEIVGKKVKLKPRGKEYVGLSPFSNEKTPSFTVSDEKGFYHCFSSGEHGSIFDFVMKTENVDFKDAVKKLAGIAGINVEDQYYKKEDSLFNRKIKVLKDLLKLTSDWFQENLQRELKSNSLLREIFVKRGFDKKVINDFQLGYAPDDFNATYDYLKSKNFTAQDILDSGLLIISEKNKKRYDRFKNRIIFPIFNYYNNVVGFGGKSIKKNQLPKYMNSPSTILYKKGDLLFGWVQAKDEIIKKKRMFLVEGYTDVISMHKIGYKNTVAPLGTALTSNQIIKSWQICNEPIVCLDGDIAGVKAAKRIAEMILPYLKPGCSISFVQLPIDEDPDSLIRSNNLKKLNSSINSKVSLVDFLWKDLIYGKEFNTPEKKAELEIKSINLVNSIKDQKVKKNYNNFFKEKFFEHFKFKFKQYNYIKKENLEEKETINADKIIEIVLLSSIIIYPKLLNSVHQKFFSINFSSSNFNEIKNIIFNLYNSKKLIENSDLDTKLISLGYHETISKLIDKSIYVHAPFLKSKKYKYDDILTGWNEYWMLYVKKKGKLRIQKEAENLLQNLNIDNFKKFKDLKLSLKKKLV